MTIEQGAGSGPRDMSGGPALAAPPAEAAGGGDLLVPDRSMTRRRRIALALNGVSFLILFAAMAWILSQNGFLAREWLMLAAYALTLPWLTIGVWNAIIGLALDLRHGSGAAARVTPALRRIAGDEPITARIAIVMPLRNEDPASALARFRHVQQGLALTPHAGRFDFHVLSDTDRPEIAAREAALVAAWQQAAPGVRIRYRRRPDNHGFKSGNIAEFVHRCRDSYDFFLPLDADSVMGAAIILRLVRVMQASPEIGMLQSLVTGLPSRTFFTRAFQFGMRHGMRAFTLGSAWWQGDCGPNWGHNVLIRLAPFAEHCMLPVLPGRGPLAGHLLSHDQVEAVLMRRAGFETRVVAEESDSHEENPPSLTDFIRRELRWCNGNMQYIRLLHLPGLRPASRVQLLLAILMYASAPAWMVFVLAGASMAGHAEQFAGLSIELCLGFFALLVTLSLAPKLMGLAQVLASSRHAERYGGRRRVFAGGAAEILFGMLVAPVVGFALSLFLFGLLIGRRIGWEAQQRSRERLHWREAARVLWPQTLAGLGLAAWLLQVAPWAAGFGAPVLVALAGAIPLAVITTLPAMGRWSRSLGLFDIPEDRSATFATSDLTGASPEPDFA